MTIDDSVVLMAFSVDHAARVAKLSKSRLTRWDKLGFFSPEYSDESDRGKPYARVYSFNDLVGLRTLALLTDKYGVTLSELKKVAPELEKRATRPWSELQLAVVKRKVVFDLDTAPRDGDGQLIGRFIPLGPIAAEVAADAGDLRSRDSTKVGMIERTPFVSHKRPVLAGTRIPAAAIESFLIEGYSDDDIIAEYPSLNREDIGAVRNYMKVAA
ncbi:DUF433 domain-containing protein [uncultured Erythrobacter sp.]|uniref:DUF433 domain-containing protein n=1 Tax=uncultured Erythrobacter sp. TaxID=263913 RepID=UPI002623D0A0|nr:DUF433 domain-containing protein [uncultured Erythrobacter sp.]